MNSNQIRKTFLDFFESKKHTIVPSAPMVVKNDPTLMFTNAGMNQFKDIFLGNEPAKSPRVADSQKCLRVSGKHNDLEEVGHDTYHHTMFEMLGNWSFGDYFKKEAIDWAWELLVDRLGLDPKRMYATVFEGYANDGVDMDQEAYDLWAKYLPKDHILMGNKKDNFWEMGDTGPCGPCSEIHYDLRDDSDRALVNGAELVNQDNPLVIEIWNLVFMQYNRKVGGALELLPAKHVDTGMGFERLCMVIQGKKSNYDTDVFQPLIRQIASISGNNYGINEKQDIAMRVIADHTRTIAFSIADGQLPSNVKAGYVIRRILRRAVRYAYTYLSVREPFITKLVPTLVEQMGVQFPELKANQNLIENVIREEENSFLRTLETGISLLDNLMKKAQDGVINGKDAFVLYDTYGFPIDLTELIARENGIGVNIEEFEKELEIQKNRSRNAASVETEDWVEIMPVEQSQFVGYDHTSYDLRISKMRAVTSKGKTLYQLVFDFTPFYGNSGGQVGDTGYIESADERIEIIDTVKENNLTIHIAKKLPENPEAQFRGVVNLEKRRASNCNHTATHLLHKALRDLLGSHVEQKGSLVTPEYLRFDFSHFERVTPEQLRQVEKAVNRVVRENRPLVEDRACSMETATKMGATMLFGEKYGDKVRVIKYGDSVELCGGTHVGGTGEIGLFRIVSEGSSASGIRRIEAVTAATAEQLCYDANDNIAEVASILGTPQYMNALRKIMSENSEMERKLNEFKAKEEKETIQNLLNSFESFTTASGESVEFIACRMDKVAESLKNVCFALKDSEQPRFVVIGCVNNDKPMIAVAFSDALLAKGLNAGQIVKAAAQKIQGGGGGQAAFASAGGKNASAIQEAIDEAKRLIEEKL